MARFIELIGHDGSDILWPTLGERFKRKSFHIEECLLTAYQLGYPLTMIEAEARHTPSLMVPPKYIHFDLKHLLKGREAVVIGSSPNRHNHSTAWNKTFYVDPDIQDDFIPKIICLR